jgi:hypothetical protein
MSFDSVPTNKLASDVLRQWSEGESTAMKDMGGISKRIVEVKDKLRSATDGNPLKESELEHILPPTIFWLDRSESGIVTGIDKLSKVVCTGEWKKMKESDGKGGWGVVDDLDLTLADGRWFHIVLGVNKKSDNDKGETTALIIDAEGPEGKFNYKLSAT